MSKELVVVKSNKLIESYHNMSLNEMRILLLTIAKLDVVNPTNIFEFNVQDFIDAFNADNKSAYKQVQNAIDTLGSRWVIIADTQKYKEKVPFFSKQIYYKNSGKFMVKLHEDLMPFLCDLTREFTRYELKHIIKFKSFHSIRLYELLAQYKKLKSRIINIDQLKKWFLLEDAYDRFTNFETFVIKPAISDINEYSDLNVIYNKIKNGRKVESIKFNIEVKESKKQIKNEVDKKQKKQNRESYLALPKNYYLYESIINTLEAHKENKIKISDSECDFLNNMKEKFEINAEFSPSEKQKNFLTGIFNKYGTLKQLKIELSQDETNKRIAKKEKLKSIVLEPDMILVGVNTGNEYLINEFGAVVGVQYKNYTQDFLTVGVNPIDQLKELVACDKLKIK